MKKITSREKIIMLLAFVLIAIVLFENLFMQPLRESVKSIDADIAKRQEIISGLQSQQMGYNSITADLERSIAEYNKTVGQFPAIWDDSEMLRFMEDVIGDDLEKSSLSFAGIKEYGDYNIGTFNAVVHGTIENFMFLLSRLEASKYFNTVNSVSISRFNYDDEEVDIQFTVNFYILVDN